MGRRASSKSEIIELYERAFGPTASPPSRATVRPPKKRKRQPKHHSGDLIARVAQFTPAIVARIIESSLPRKLPAISSDKVAKLARDLDAAAFYWKFAAQADNKFRENADNAPWKGFIRDIAAAYAQAFGKRAVAHPRGETYARRDVDGPFVRFAIGALRVIDQQITAEAIRDILRDKQPAPRHS